MAAGNARVRRHTGVSLRRRHGGRRGNDPLRRRGVAAPAVTAE